VSLIPSIAVNPVHPFNPKYLEWNSPYLDLELTIQVYRGGMVNHTYMLICTFPS